jgi:hypothetical protein
MDHRISFPTFSQQMNFHGFLSKLLLQLGSSDFWKTCLQQLENEPEPVEWPMLFD